MRITAKIENHLSIAIRGGISGFIAGTAVGAIFIIIQNYEGFIPHWVGIGSLLFLWFLGWLSAFLFGIPAAFLGVIQGFTEGLFGRFSYSVIIWPTMIAFSFFVGNLVINFVSIQSALAHAILFGIIASLIAWSIGYNASPNYTMNSFTVAGYGLVFILLGWGIPFLLQFMIVVFSD